ncbi:hypothetical protein, partial [Moheibacter sediminis]
MRKHLFYLLLFSTLFTQAQITPEIEWSKTLGSTSMDVGRGVVQTSDGGYIAFGQVMMGDADVTNFKGGVDYWIAKTSVTGELEWEKTYGGSLLDFGGDDQILKIRQTQDGGYILGGTSNSDDGDVTHNYGMEDIWLVKIDSSGNIQWEKNYGGSGEDVFRDIQPTDDGGYILTGRTTSSDGDINSEYIELGAYTTAWVAKLDDSGNIEWSNDIGGYDTFFNEFFSIYPVSDGYVATGSSDGVGGDIPSDGRGSSDFWVVKMDISGQVVWSKLYGGPSMDQPSSIRPADDGGYVVAGYVSQLGGDVTESYGGQDIWILKLNNDGNLEWQKSIGGSRGEGIQEIQTTLDGGYVVGGYTLSTDGHFEENASKGEQDKFLLKINSTGDIVWTKTFGGSSHDILWGFEITSEGGFITIGSTNSIDGDLVGKENNDFDYWIVKLSPDCLVPELTIDTTHTICVGEELTLTADA